MGYESLFTPFKIGNMEVKNRPLGVPFGRRFPLVIELFALAPRKSIISLKEQKEEPVSFIWDVKC